MTRVFEYLIVASWLVSLSWLGAREAIPKWFAKQPPDAVSADWLHDHGQRFQYGIYGADGVNRGSCWTVYDIAGDLITRTDYVVLNHVPVLRRIILTSEVQFDAQHQPDKITIQVGGLQANIVLEGRRQGPKFAFLLKIGTEPAQEFVLEDHVARTLSDVIKPFSTMKNLQVGRAWKIYTVDPFSIISGGAARLSPVLVQVTGQARITSQGREVECFVVEAPNAKAWVDADGRVLLQEADVPGLGKLSIREQTFRMEQFREVAPHKAGVRTYHERDRNR